jgi:drug/metabolite transporter (DMT)-like permease
VKGRSGDARVGARFCRDVGGVGKEPNIFLHPFERGFLDAGWTEASGEAWEALAYSTLLVAAFGFWAWQRGVSQVGANRVLIYQYLITLVGVAAGVLLLGESLTANKVLGGAVILLGVYLARRR